MLFFFGKPYLILECTFFLGAVWKLFSIGVKRRVIFLYRAGFELGFPGIVETL